MSATPADDPRGEGDRLHRRLLSRDPLAPPASMAMSRNSSDGLRQVAEQGILPPNRLKLLAAATWSLRLW